MSQQMPPIKQPTPTYRRIGGQHRAEQFDRTHQRNAANQRVRQETFLPHNQTIAQDGYAAISAYMRAPAGLRLLHPEHIQFLRPEQLGGKDGAPLSPREQRLRFGLYVWRMVWDNLPFAPPMPTDEEYLLQVNRVQALVGRGLPLEAPLDAVFLAPGDLCDGAGVPYAARKQRRLFRAALRTACEAAQHWHEDVLRALKADQQQPPRKLGQRRPMQALTTEVQHNPQISSPAHGSTYGRRDLPAYDPANISPTRPYAVPSAARMHGWWMSADTRSIKEDE